MFYAMEKKEKSVNDILMEGYNKEKIKAEDESYE
jgi:hypothetical protein